MTAVQAAFAAALLDPALPPPAAVTARAGASVAQRFAIYRNNVVVGLIDALAEGFPVVERLVGTEFFRALARCYLTAHPPHSRLMVEFGDSFGTFIDQFEPAATLPYLGDVARLEAARTRAFHAADAQSLDGSALAGVAAETRLMLHPSLRLIASPHPVVSIWQANLASGEVPPIARWNGQTALVLRPALEVVVRAISGDTGHFIGLLSAGGTVGEAAAAVFDRAPGFDLGGAIKLVATAGMVTAVA
jgi:hypothetical protein